LPLNLLVPPGTDRRLDIRRKGYVSSEIMTNLLLPTKPTNGRSEQLRRVFSELSPQGLFNRLGRPPPRRRLITYWHMPLGVNTPACQDDPGDCHLGERRSPVRGRYLNVSLTAAITSPLPSRTRRPFSRTSSRCMSATSVPVAGRQRAPPPGALRRSPSTGWSTTWPWSLVRTTTRPEAAARSSNGRR
jgi:hypothetical protein